VLIWAPAVVLAQRLIGNSTDAHSTEFDWAAPPTVLAKPLAPVPLQMRATRVLAVPVAMVPLLHGLDVQAATHEVGLLWVLGRIEDAVSLGLGTFHMGHKIHALFIIFCLI
jgi:hypothetical protein